MFEFDWGWANVRRIGCARTGYYVCADNVGRVSLMRSLVLVRQGPSADASIQLIQERVQPTLARVTSGHLPQDLAHFRRGVLDRPADVSVADSWIALLVELKR